MRTKRDHEAELAALRAVWERQWEPALAVWSRFTKLRPPVYCTTEKEEAAQQLTGSFAMIRLNDHRVVISLRQVHEQGLGGFATEVLAHEIGHHVYTPADLRDNARLLARIRHGLPSREAYAGLISNLYTDLLINNRLQRDAGLDIAGVYAALAASSTGGGHDSVWTLYMRMYEILWSLQPASLARGKLSAEMRVDADLGARLIRSYAKDWLSGAGRFACLMLPYLLELPDTATRLMLAPWMDVVGAGAGEVIPDGLAELDEGELEGLIHPADDPDLAGFGSTGEPDIEARGRAQVGGTKNRYRSPSEYKELMRGIGVKVDERDLVIRYYRERAIPHLVRFPTRVLEESADPLPEGVDLWDVGNSLQSVDWFETVARSPTVIPGVTTLRRTYGSTAGTQPEVEAVDLFLGVDCSGSMMNPALGISYPVLAGTVMVISALRVGARVKVCLSGEPGEFSETDGFVRSERDALGILTGYLGTGYAFGLKRLEATFLTGAEHKRATHILVVSDSDIFHMLNQLENGWEIARDAVEVAGGGGTMVLDMPHRQDFYADDIDRLRAIGWDLHFVDDMEKLVTFARAFSRTKYGRR